VDWSQNDDHKTTICVYSLRAKERPTVSTPVTWEEVENCLRRRDPKLLAFEALQVLERVKEDGDLYEPVLTLKQKLPDLGGQTAPARKNSSRRAAKPKKPRAPAARS
jgi:bifunctional non-homologous end joining protein LigD